MALVLFSNAYSRTDYRPTDALAFSSLPLESYTMSKMQKTPTGPFNPFYGCAIMIIMVLTFGGLISWVGYTLLKQDKEIASFTQEVAPAMTEIVLPDTAKTALRAKLSAFADATNKGLAADLALNVDELNGLLVLAFEDGVGQQEGSAPYRDIVRFTGFDVAAKLVKTDIRLPMNKLPWAGGGQRYIVGSATFIPESEGKNFDLKLDNIVVPDKKVSPGFINNLNTLPWLSVAKQKPEIAAALEKVTSFELPADGRSIVFHAAASAPPAAK